MLPFFLIADINECLPTNDCMQQCENTQGSYNCSCNQHFETDPTDWRNCVGKCQSWYTYFRITPWRGGGVVFSSWDFWSDDQMFCGSRLGLCFPQTRNFTPQCPSPPRCTIRYRWTVRKINPIDPDIKMHILLTVLHALLMRICLNIKSFLLGHHFLHSHHLNVLTVHVKRNFIFVTVRA